LLDEVVGGVLQQACHLTEVALERGLDRRRELTNVAHVASLLWASTLGLRGALGKGYRIRPGSGRRQQNARRNFRSDSVSTDASTCDSVASSAAPSGKTNNMVCDPRRTTALSTRIGRRVNS